MMNITLCFDFGNTRLKCAVFEDKEVKDVIVLQDDSEQTIHHLVQKYQPQKSILSSVINHNKKIEEILTATTKFHLLNHLSKLPVHLPVGKPETIGADRLAVCAAAIHLHPHNHSLAIGLGTCIVYNYINPANEFLGGSIAPGMAMRFKALHEQTVTLPLIKAGQDFPLIGYDTKTNLLSGVIIGMAKEIDGVIDLYKEKFNGLQVFLTGGDTKFFTPFLKNKVIADDNLLFKGLLAISELNNI